MITLPRSYILGDRIDEIVELRCGIITYPITSLRVFPWEKLKISWKSRQAYTVVGNALLFVKITHPKYIGFLTTEYDNKYLLYLSKMT